MSDNQAETIREMVRRALIEVLGDSTLPLQASGRASEESIALPSVQAAAIEPQSPREYYSPWVGTAYESHPTQRLLIEDSLSGQTGLSSWSVIVGQECPLEKRPCDDCGRCRSLGF